MNKEDFQKYYDTNRYSDEVFLEYYMENAPAGQKVSTQVFLENFPIWRQSVNIMAALHTVINYYVDKYKIKRKYNVQLLSKDGTLIKHLPPIYDRN